MKILGIIPARGGSKGVPRKNVRMLAGKPLIAHTIDTARASGVFDRIIVTTDDAEIAAIAKEYGAEVPFLRPAHLAEDTTPTLPVIVHAVQALRETDGYAPDLVAILQPTTPMRKTEHLIEARDMFERHAPDSVISLRAVPPHHSAHWQFHVSENGVASIATGETFEQLIPRRQSLPITYTRNGAIYLLRANLLDGDNPSIYGKDVRAIIMDAESSVNIDTEEDFLQAEEAAKKRI